MFISSVESKTILFTGGTSGLGKVATIWIAINGSNVIATVAIEVKSKSLLIDLNYIN
jgi:NADPH:quinone reductase-like Zn-dependent oxidoreductase